MRAFTWVMLVGREMERKKKEEEKGGIWEGMERGGMEVKGLVGGMKRCEVRVGEKGGGVVEGEKGRVEV